MDDTGIETVTAHAESSGSAGASVPAGRRFGSLVSIAMNGFLLYVANNMQGWDILPFLTDDFDRVLPAINLSLVVTIAFNIARLWFAPRWFIPATDIVSGIFSIGATVRILQVFPFDFDPYDFPWDIVAKLALVLAIIGSVIAIVVNMVKLALALPGAVDKRDHQPD